ncbi:hypothetical protein ACFR9U_13285 [Halorientalis brevis]|uniref:Peptidase family M23 n=1 Tax=Halorientalis brevis TaxID=1126241 RepID=A0ABD6CDL7_9EURY|nr:hypothetical protein [Halorientalis brevis]
MAVTLDGDVVGRYPRVSLYNSPYTAHDRGCAIDLYPDGDGTAPSPVAGEVLDTRTVDAPPKPYAGPHDHLVLIETDEYVARVLHVEPTVEPGDHVAVGDSLGRLVRSGFFAPWVDNHVHLGFRDPDANPYRASGSLPVAVDVDVRPCQWDGHGTVVETAETYAVLDAPAHPAPGDYFVGVDGGDCVLDGGLPHYDGGGALGGADGPVTLAGQRVGTAEGRTVAWDDVTVRANGRPITGLSLFLAREAFGVKLVCPEQSFAVGEDVTVSIDSA